MRGKERVLHPVRGREGGSSSEMFRKMETRCKTYFTSGKIAELKS